ncbi:MAG: molybdopterin-dependent oxidoreductase, partial [Proteobacteria bacterium]|nr:molybdopterin-dependent oxidoreductase [Pseudomonadota bacterium]
AFRKMEIGFPGGYDRLSGCELIIVAGADLLVNNHLLANKVRETVKTKSARVIVIDPLPASLTRIADAHLQPAPGQDASLFNALSRRLLEDGGYGKEAEKLKGFSEFKSALLSDAAASSAAPGGVEEATLEKAYKLIRDAENIALVFGSGISDREGSMAALLNFCLLKGLPEKGAIIPTALQANARGAVSIIDDIASPDEVLLDAGISGIFIYEEDPFHFLCGELVKGALAKKAFVAVCDILPTEAMDLAHLTLPSTVFAEKEGTVISGDGSTRTVARAYAGMPGGPEFLRELLNRLGGKPYSNSDELRDDLNKSLLAKYGGAGNAAPAGKGRFLVTPATDAPTRPYRLILRDIFASHHLAGREVYAKGVSQVQKDALFISPGDAAALNLTDGDGLYLESADGDATRPVTVKAGVKQGVLECLLFRKRREMLALSLKPAKVIEVSVRKA